jgi:hypothetical protein
VSTPRGVHLCCLPDVVHLGACLFLSKKKGQEEGEEEEEEEGALLIKSRASSAPAGTPATAY